jgi:predicted transcriptional regulator
MRIEKTRRQAPQSSQPPNSTDREAEERQRFVWEKLAPYLLQPSKLAFIQALLEHARPLTLRELAEAAEITKEHARHQCKSMQMAGVVEVVNGDHADGIADEPSYFFPEPPYLASCSAPRTAR